IEEALKQRELVKLNKSDSELNNDLEDKNDNESESDSADKNDDELELEYTFVAIKPDNSALQKMTSSAERCDAAEFILLGANTVQVCFISSLPKFVKFTILANRRNGSGQGFRLAQLQDQLPSNEPEFFHRIRLRLLTLKQKAMYLSTHAFFNTIKWIEKVRAKSASDRPVNTKIRRITIVFRLCNRDQQTMTPNITDITQPARVSLRSRCEDVAAINTIMSVMGINLTTTF
nr:dihydropyrimidine dehydrogenase (NADP(+)), chloroplastic [Tanacetum cinerariifolium]